MEKNQKIRVSDSAPHHAGRVGYFQFLGTEVSAGCAICANDPTKEGVNNCMNVFVVDEKNLIAVR